MTNIESNDDQLKMRVLPHNMEAEQSLLGIILLNNEFFESISDFLLPQHFAAEINGKIYDVISRLNSQGLVADPITIRLYFEKSDELKDIGCGNYLVQLVNSVIPTGKIEDYAKLIYDLYIRRKLILLGDDIVQKAITFDLNIKATDQIESAEAKLYELSASDKKDGLVSFSGAISSTMPILEAAYKSDSSVTGITTGFVDIDKWTGGLNRSDLVILAGRPSMGKTALATNIAFNAAMALAKKSDGGGKVAFYSLEMSKEQLVTRVLSQECCVPSERIRRGEIKEEDFVKLTEANKRIGDLSFFIDDTPALTMSALRSRSRKLKRQQGLDLIIVDYLQLLHGSAEKKTENRVQEISDITRALKALAKELDIPVLALSQLSRAVEVRDDKRPQLSDLRESGSIEQDADVVMFVFREEYYESRREPTDSEEHRKWLDKMTKIHNLAELIIAKQRHGPVGTVRLFFDGKYTKFDNLSDSRKNSLE
jgi:replicative DNA helicase